MSGSKTVGRLRAILGLERRGFQQGLRDSEGDLKRFTGAAQAMGGRLKGILGLSIAGVGLQQLASQARAAVRSIASVGDEAKRAGMSAKAFQEWKFVAEQNRIGIDAVVDGFKELNLRADEFIVTGGGSAADAFSRLGFSALDLKQKLKDPSALMLEIIGRLDGLDKAAQIRIADELFGGSAGEQFLQILDQGEAGVRKIIDRAHEVGAVIDTDMIGKAQELDAKFNELGTSLDNLWKRGVVGAATFFGFVNERLNDLITEGEGLQILGPELYSALSQIGTLTDEQVEKIRLLKGAYAEMAMQAVDAADALVWVIGSMEDGQLRDDLIAASLELRRLGEGFRDGTVSATELRDGVEAVRTKTVEAVDALSAADQVAFSGVIGEIGALSTALDGPIGRAKELWGWLQAAAGMGPDAKAGTAGLSRNPFEVSSTPPMTKSPRPQMPGVDSYGNWQEAGNKSKGGGGGGGEKDQYARRIASIKEQTAALNAEAAALAYVVTSGVRYGDAVEYARTRAELLNAAQKEGKDITPQLLAEVDALALSYVQAGQAAEDSARQLERVAQNSKRGSDEIANIFASAVEGSDAAKRAVAQLLLEIARVQMMRGVAGLLGGGGFSGFVGGMLDIGANSTGTSNWRGGLSRVNELGGEILDLPKGTRVIPADISKRMADRSHQREGLDVNVTASFDAEGSGIVRRVSTATTAAGLRQQQRAMPGAMHEARVRGTR